jgi:hypothetical protein
MSRTRIWAASGAVLAAAAVAVLAATAIVAPRAHAAASAPGQLYYINGTEIMRVPVTGGAAQRVANAGSDSVTGMTIADGRLFWVNEVSSNEAIRYVTVSNPAQVHTLITGLDFPAGLVAAGGWLYYVDQNAIGRVRFNGTGLSRRFIKLPQENGGGVAQGLATDGSHLYVSRCQNGEIGRVALSGASLDLGFIKLPKNACPQQLAVGNTHIYWTELGGHVGRAMLTGQGASDTWLNIRETQGPFNVAADNAGVFWDWGGAAGAPMYVGTASVSGTSVRTRFLTGQGAFLLTAPGSSS